MMHRPLYVLTALLLAACGSSTVLAEDAGCSGQQAAPALRDGNDTLCFRLTPLLDDAGKPVPGEEPQIAIVQITPEKPERVIATLPYLGGTGTVRAAFLADISGPTSKRDLVVIHSIPPRSDIEEPYVGDYYSVRVFSPGSKGLAENLPANEFFAEGADVAQQPVTDPPTRIFSYPFKTEAEVRAALSSPLYAAMRDRTLLPARVKATKAPLYRSAGTTETSNQYLVANDRVSVNEATGGWCHMAYTGNGGLVIQAWLDCALLAPETAAP